MVSTIGAFFMAAAALLLVWNLAASLLRGRPAGDNPWKAWTLEWAAASPPPQENFDALPPIRSRRPLWDDANPDRPDPMVGSREAGGHLLPGEDTRPASSPSSSPKAAFFGVLILAYLYYNAAPQPGPSARDLNLLKTGLLQPLPVREQLHHLALGGRPGSRQTAARWPAGWRRRSCWAASFIIGQGLEYRGLFQSGVSVQHQSVRDDIFHADRLPRLACLRRLDRAADRARAGAGRRFQARAARPRSRPSGFTGISSMSSGCSCFRPFTSCPTSDDHRTIPSRGLDLESGVAPGRRRALWPLIWPRSGDRRRVGYFAGGARRVSADAAVAARHAGRRLSLQRAHGAAHPAAADRAGIAAAQPAALAGAGRAPARPRRIRLAGWLAGVGAMWFWHAPALCNAAVASRPVHALQTVSLLVLGAVFWRQILAPREAERLSPPGAVLYLFSACVACSVLGIIITFSPVDGLLDLHHAAGGPPRPAADDSRRLGLHAGARPASWGPAHVGADVPGLSGRDLRPDWRAGLRSPRARQPRRR